MDSVSSVQVFLEFVHRHKGGWFLVVPIEVSCEVLTDVSGNVDLVDSNTVSDVHTDFGEILGLLLVVNVGNYIVNALQNLKR